jgi:uncharacterized protein (TIGR02646 family)
MIRIHRPPGAPGVLVSEGAARRLAHQADVDADPASFSSGTATLTFDRAIYAHDSVKQQLIAMQHGKCAFCEAKPLPVSDGDVEHFRPKGGSRQTDGAPLEQPGYYWLAYEWGNLLFACERCNRRHKKNLFPLTEPARRARSHRDSIVGEVPFFVDPSAEDPTQYIGYREHVPIAIAGNVRGQLTIDALGLSRSELGEDRETHLETLKVVHATLSLPDVPDRVRGSARNVLAKMISPAGKYSVMCRAAVAELGGLPETTVDSSTR